MAVDDLERLAGTLGTFVAQVAVRIRQAALVVASLAGAAGLVALVLGFWAWHDDTATLVLVALVCVPAALTPVFAYRRLKPIAEAVAHPDETARQARSYFAGLHGSPELDQLVQQAAGLSRAGRGMRLRGLYRSTRLLGSVIGSVAPDPRTQPLVAAFQPTRLRSIWLAVLWSWWLWMLAFAIAVVATANLLVDAVV